MDEFTQVKAVVPRHLKCKVFSALALREETFRHWLCCQMERCAQEVERDHSKESEGGSAGLARSATRS